MLDVHAIAVDHTAVPITRWSVRIVSCGTQVGEVLLSAGRFVASGPGDVPTFHDSLRAARDHLAGVRIPFSTSFAGQPC